MGLPRALCRRIPFCVLSFIGVLWPASRNLNLLSRCVCALHAGLYTLSLQVNYGDTAKVGMRLSKKSGLCVWHIGLGFRELQVAGRYAASGFPGSVTEQNMHWPGYDFQSVSFGTYSSWPSRNVRRTHRISTSSFPTVVQQGYCSMSKSPASTHYTRHAKSL